MLNADAGDWMYTAKGQRAHFVVSGFGGGRKTLCPMGGVNVYHWFGTGTHDEYMTAAEMPRCKHCVKEGAPPDAIARVDTGGSSAGSTAHVAVI